MHRPASIVSSQSALSAQSHGVHARALRLHERREFDGKGLLPFRVIARDAANANAIFECAQGVNKRRGTFQHQLNCALPLFKQMQV